MKEGISDQLSSLTGYSGSFLIHANVKFGGDRNNTSIAMVTGYTK
jgi:hypothetical protein